MSEMDAPLLFDEVKENHPSPRPGVSEAEAGLLAALIQRSRLYRSGPEYLALLQFVSQMRHIAPFNAALLHMQKPGLRFAATDVDWFGRFRRTVKEGARPLVILWPMSPVALVYDVEDTEGPELPADVAAPFRAQGDITEDRLQEMFYLLGKHWIDCRAIEYGQAHAGHVRVAVNQTWKTRKGNDRRVYAIRVNAAHDPNVQFATLAHELGHLYLGHLGKDEGLDIKSRRGLGYSVEELEAEAVAFLVCERQGVRNESETYLAKFVRDTAAVASLDIYAVTKAAGRAEQALGLASTIDVGTDRKGKLTAPLIERAASTVSLDDPQGLV